MNYVDWKTKQLLALHEFKSLKACLVSIMCGTKILLPQIRDQIPSRIKLSSKISIEMTYSKFNYKHKNMSNVTYYNKITEL